jgi:hypothetical protein
MKINVEAMTILTEAGEKVILNSKDSNYVIRQIVTNSIILNLRNFGLAGLGLCVVGGGIYLGIKHFNNRKKKDEEGA